MNSKNKGGGDGEFISIKEKLPENHRVCEIVVDGQTLDPLTRSENVSRIY